MMPCIIVICLFLQGSIGSRGATGKTGEAGGAVSHRDNLTYDVYVAISQEVSPKTPRSCTSLNFKL